MKFEEHDGFAGADDRDDDDARVARGEPLEHTGFGENGMERVQLLLGTDAPMTDLLSDWLQSTQAVLWDNRRGSACLTAHGMTGEQVEKLLLSLAADIHEKRTDERVGAVLVEDGNVHSLHFMISQIRTHPPEESKGIRYLIQQLRELVQQRGMH